MGNTIANMLLNMIVMLMSLSVHEFAHALTADRLGDDTPRRQGRLTLSPLAHYDLFGTLLIPAIGSLLGSFSFIGWARPVEISPRNLTRRLSMRAGSAVVAAAGPLSNLVLATVSMALLAWLVDADPAAPIRSDTLGATAYLLNVMVIVNIGLFVFNLIPLPPLDGSRLLPRSMDGFQEAVAPYSFLVLMLILNIAPLRHLLFAPVGHLFTGLRALFGLPGYL